LGVVTGDDGRRRRGDVRRALLLDAGVRVVAGAGAGNLTHRATAAEAGVSLASVTYHFPSIEGLRRATFDHAGSLVGLAFRDRVLAEDAHAEDVGTILADYATALVADRREATVAVFEMITAATHDPELRPVVEILNARLAALLAPYVGSHPRALTAAAALQGLILTALATGIESPDALHAAVLDLITRFRARPPRGDASDDATTRSH
jgi:DNA-binding transcriptional regulator YbjK